MSRLRGIAWVAAIVALAAVGFVSAGRSPRPAPAAAAPTRVDPGSSRRTAIVSAAERVSPAVVSISVSATRLVRESPFPGMPRDEFFDRFFPQMEYQQHVSSLGSGVIVGPAGLVVTNEHVVSGADSVTVTLPDGRRFKGRILGGSEVYDLAVLKIDGGHLPVAPLGDSDNLLVGEWAIAIGNPFGYLINDSKPTVTAGVISATGRDIKSGVTEAGIYKNMIQTDAAINPGNSGGALANAEGEIVGINTFIFTSGGGSIGLGFAIPINLVKRVLAEVQTYGRVRTAWPGMQVQPVSPAIAEQLGFRDARGLVVTRVEPGGPAAKADVRVGDRIAQVNGQTVDSVEDAQRSIYGAGVGDRLALSIERAGHRMELSLTLAEAPRRNE
jgi:serine protease Do